jgi:lysophospholipase L1-like esterase
MLGSNDIGFANMTPDRLIANYDKFVKGIKDASPDSLIYLQSVFPVTKVYEAKRPAYTNETIDSYNERIRLMAADNNVLYLNVAEAVKDANNDLMQDLSPKEGMHIEKKGYYIWLEYVLSHRMTEG